MSKGKLEAFTRTPYSSVNFSVTVILELEDFTPLPENKASKHAANHISNTVLPNHAKKVAGNSKASL
jgi:hypothetical protein